MSARLRKTIGPYDPFRLSPPWQCLWRVSLGRALGRMNPSMEFLSLAQLDELWMSCSPSVVYRERNSSSSTPRRVSRLRTKRKG